MTKKELAQIPKLKNEIRLLDRDLHDLPLTKDSVKGSMPEFPYIQRVIVIKGTDEEKGEQLREKMERKLDQLQDRLLEFEDWLDGVEDSEMRTILRLKFRNGLTDWEIAAELGYDRSTVSGKIRDFFRLDEDSPKSPI